jgi:hypothetical protein
VTVAHADIPALDHRYAEPRYVWKETLRAVATLLCRRQGHEKAPCAACRRLAAPLVVPIAEGLFRAVCGQPTTLGMDPARTKWALDRVGAALEVIERAAVVVTRDGGPPPVKRPSVNEDP